MHDVASPLTAWSNFYVITGSSAGALTGLMFVVITLVAAQRMEQRGEGLGTFSTPTVVHFCTALLVSAVISAPWPSLIPVAVVLGIAGIYGIVYCALVTHRTRRLSVYRADPEDWTWYSILPLVSYIVITVGALRLVAAPYEALYEFAAATLLLIFIGIHNSWDVVTYLTVLQYEDDGEATAASASASPSPNPNPSE
jgi:hypothetical protein